MFSTRTNRTSRHHDQPLSRASSGGCHGWSGLEPLEPRVLLDAHLAGHITSILIVLDELHSPDEPTAYEFELAFSAEALVSSARFQIEGSPAWHQMELDDDEGFEWFFEIESEDQADLAAFIDAAYTLEITFAELGVLTTTVIFAAQDTGAPLEAPTQVPVLLEPEIGSDGGAPTLTINWEPPDQAVINMLLLEIERQGEGDGDDFDVVDALLFDAPGPNTYGPVTLPGDGLYDVELSFMNVSSGLNDDGILVHAVKSVTMEVPVLVFSGGGGLSDTLFDVFIGRLDEHHEDGRTGSMFNFHFFTFDPSVRSARFLDVNGHWWNMIGDNMSDSIAPGVRRFTWTSWSGPQEPAPLTDHPPVAGPPGFGTGDYLLELKYADQSTVTTSFFYSAQEVAAPQQQPVLTGPLHGAQGVDLPATFTFGQVTDPSVDAIVLLVKKGDNGFGVPPTWGTDEVMGLFGEPVEGSAYTEQLDTTEFVIDTLLPSRTYNYALAFANLVQGANEDGVAYTSARATGSWASFSTLTANAPDLTIEAQVLNLPESVLAGRAVKLAYTLRNLGDRPASGGAAFHVYLSSDDTLDEGDTLIAAVNRSLSLAAGGRATGTVSVTLPADTATGQYHLLVVADANDNIPEFREDNNLAVTQMINIEEAYVDLSGAFHAVLLNEALLPGAKGKAVVAVTNNGNIKAVGQTTIKLYASTDGEFGADDVLIGAVTGATGIAPGATRNFAINLVVPADTPADNYFLLAVIDSEDQIAESDEENNIALSDSSFEVADPHIDISGEFGAILLADTLVPGNKGKVQLALTNHGNVVASGPAAINLYASTSGEIDGDAVLITTYTASVNLRPGASKSYRINLVLPPELEEGDYFLVADIDVDNQLDERDETNNVAVTDTTRPAARQFGAVGDKANVRLTVADSALTPVTFVLRGAGTGTVTLNGAGEFDIALTGTDATTVVTITTPGGTETVIHDINADGPVKAIVARTADLTGDITIAGALGSLVLDDIDADSDNVISIGGDGSGGVVLSFDEVGDLSIHSDTPIRALSATQWEDARGGDDQVAAPWLGVLKIGGDTARGLAGNFQAALRLTSTEIARTLNKANIAGWWENSQSFIAGHAGVITAGGLRDASILIGVADSVTGLPETLADFTNFRATLGTLKLLGVAGEADALINSTLAAYAMGKVMLRDVQEDNAGAPFGLAATSIRALTRNEAGTVHKFPTTWPDDDGDFLVRLIADDEPAPARVKRA